MGRALAAAVFGAILAAGPAFADEEGDKLVEVSHDFVAAAPLVEIRQTVEETALVEGTAGPSSSTRTTVIEIDSERLLTRLVTKDASGQDLIVIRHGEALAMKIGDGPWQPPAGAYAQMRETLANPFACPMPTRKAGSPEWRRVRADKIGEVEADLIETVGESAVPYTQARMEEGMAATIHDPAARPKLTVESYKSRIWVAKDDHRRLVVEQTARLDLLVQSSIHVHVDSNTTSAYRYGSVRIDIPAEAQAILAPSKAEPPKK